MELNKQVTKLMGQKVAYCRARPKEGSTTGETELYYGKGIIVGVIIGASRRIQVMVKDEAENKSAALSLDLVCIDPTKADAERYFEHHLKVKAMVAEHNVAQSQREQEKIKEVDELNAEMFGAMLAV